jgi:hypothetical protein
VVYLYTDSGYYQYDNTDAGVVMTPDPTTPVVAPPDPTPAPVNQTTVYSQDGTRSVQVNGANRDAYLYDLTATDPNSAAAQAKFIGTQVAGVKFDYVTANGIATQSIQQIELSYDAPSALSVVSLASGASAPSLSYTTITDDSGNSSLSLQSVAITVTDGSGLQTTLTFDRDGNSLNTPAQSSAAPTPAPSAIQTLQDKFQGSATFQSLKSGFGF